MACPGSRSSLDPSFAQQDARQSSSRMHDSDYGIDLANELQTAIGNHPASAAEVLK